MDSRKAALTVVLASAMTVVLNTATSANIWARSNYPEKKMTIQAGSQVVSNPIGLWAIDPSTSQYTTYMPIWYVMQALDRFGVQSQWDGKNWNLTLPSALAQKFNSNPAAYSPGTGTCSIYVDGVPVQDAMKIVNNDPASNQPTTYVPIWYVGKVIRDFGMNYIWDGTTWTIGIPQNPQTGSNNTTSGSGAGGLLGGLTGTLGNVTGGLTGSSGGLAGGTSTNTTNTTTSNSTGTGSLTNAVGGATNTVGNAVGTVTNTTGTTSLLNNTTSTVTNAVSSAGGQLGL
ncbi:hypothetical protein LLE49_24495 [Alicyclobacillus tolerans]|uniref:hypothetical protein n=1 Tax=Alicyclobacillus tolerans TaxID=90970 RepID=UPI001F203B88|nr:hypothetical protein [Alicyclobacillus tolerans]MCF8567886.1 hypothetical protein [Alicyclobacillus tolerans]